MSDRKLILEILSQDNNERLELFMDGESGTWRLFVEGEPRGMGVGRLQFGACRNIDLTLVQLKELRDGLTVALNAIATDPESYNAEVRKAWQE